MKKIIAIAALAVLSLSCSDDDNNTVTTSVEGTWALTSFQLNQAFDLNGDGTASTDMLAETGCFNNTYITFNNDNTATVNFDEINITAQPIEGTTDYEFSTECLGSTAQESIYTVSGDTTSLVFTYEDGNTQTLNCTVSGNTMTVVVPALSDLPIENDDNIAYSFVGGTLVFTQQ